MTGSQTVGQLLEARQKTLGLTNVQVSQALGLKNPNVISMIKKGHTKLALKRVAPLAELLDIDASQLLYMALKERDTDDLEAINSILQPESWKDHRKLSA